MDEVRAVAESRSKAGLEIFPEIYRNGSLLECTKTRAVYKSPYLATRINEWIRATNILSVIVPIRNVLRDAEGAALSAKSAEEQLRYNVSDKLSPKLSFAAAQTSSLCAYSQLIPSDACFPASYSRRKSPTI